MIATPRTNKGAVIGSLGKWSTPWERDIDPLVMRLQAFGAIDDDDVDYLASTLPASHVVPANTVLVAEGAPAEHVHLVVDGLACRAKSISRDRRQITGYLMPGDFCDLHVFILRKMDHTIRTLSDARVIRIAHAQVKEILARPALAQSLLFSSLVEASISRQWVTNIGQRSALERLAHHFCEMFFRMKMVGLVADESFSLPVSQTELAESVGLSLVHTNKSLRSLFRGGLLRFGHKHVEILDMTKLRELCAFDTTYLHIGELQ